MPIMSSKIRIYLTLMGRLFFTSLACEGQTWKTKYHLQKLSIRVQIPFSFCLVRDERELFSSGERR